MRWVWAGNQCTLQAFGEILSPAVQAHLSLAAGGPVELNAACYIIVKDGVIDQECIPHYDFYASELPRGSAFTLMTPMSSRHPSCVGGLEFWPWIGPDNPHRDSDDAFRWDS